jgi:hypothetical protein
LYIVAHGKPGYVEIGEGLDVHTASYFRPLKGKFDGERVIYIHGCNVASRSVDANGKGSYCGSGAGFKFMKELAKETGAYVKAAIHTQYADYGMKYEGPAVMVSPAGAEIWPWHSEWR